MASQSAEFDSSCSLISRASRDAARLQQASVSPCMSTECMATTRPVRTSPTAPFRLRTRLLKFCIQPTSTQCAPASSNPRSHGRKSDAHREAVRCEIVAYHRISKSGSSRRRLALPCGQRSALGLGFLWIVIAHNPSRHSTLRARHCHRAARYLAGIPRKSTPRLNFQEIPVRNH